MDARHSFSSLESALCLQIPCSDCMAHSLGTTGLTHSFLPITVEGAFCKLKCLEYVCHVVIM